jgi:hypothetical protein
MPKKPKGRPRNPKPPEKAVIYVEVPPGLKEDMERLAAAHNRKLTGEVIQALQEYLAKHRAGPPAAGLPLPSGTLHPPAERRVPFAGPSGIP